MFNFSSARLRSVLALLAMLACGWLAGCASLIGPRQVELPLERLQQGIARRFPLDQRLLAIFDLQLSQPRLALMPDSDRVGLTVDAVLGSPLMAKSLRGALSLSGRLAIDAAGSAVVVTDARVEQIDIAGLDAQSRRQIVDVANVLTQKILLDGELYHLRPEQLRYAGVQFVPTGIVVTSRGLTVTMVAAR